jgi:hypothetical protein
MNDRDVVLWVILGLVSLVAAALAATMLLYGPTWGLAGASAYVLGRLLARLP